MLRGMGNKFKTGMLGFYDAINGIVESMCAWTELTSHLIILLRADNIIKVSFGFLFSKSIILTVDMSLLPKTHAQFKEK